MSASTMVSEGFVLDSMLMLWGSELSEQIRMFVVKVQYSSECSTSIHCHIEEVSPAREEHPVHPLAQE